MDSNTLGKIRDGAREISVQHETGHVVAAIAGGKLNVSAKIGQRASNLQWRDCGTSFEVPLTPTIAVAGFAMVALKDNAACTGEEVRDVG